MVTPLRRAALGVAALSLFGLTACGGGSASPKHAAMQAYNQCLSQHGVTLPQRDHTKGTGATPGAHPKHDPTQPPPGVDPQTWTAARTACASSAPKP